MLVLLAAVECSGYSPSVGLLVPSSPRVQRSQPIQLSVAHSPNFLRSLLPFGALLNKPSPSEDAAAVAKAAPGAAHHAKYGGDPRPSYYASVENVMGMGEERSWPLGVPGEVSELYGGVEQLQFVLDACKRENEMLVLKFKREGCPACGATIQSFAEQAAAYNGRARFFTVDYNFCRSFCQRCGIKVVPCVHFYGSDGALTGVVALGKSSWEPFVQRLRELVDGDVSQGGGEALAGEEDEAAAMEARLEEAVMRSRLW